MRIAIQGCLHGELDSVYQILCKIERQQKIKIDLLVICGDFQVSVILTESIVSGRILIWDEDGVAMDMDVLSATSNSLGQNINCDLTSENNDPFQHSL